MNNEAKHHEYIKSKGKFTIACNPVIFSPEEIALLEKYGYWFEALVEGRLLPFSAEQKQFVDVAQMRKKPETLYEKLWFRYIKRKEIELKKGATLYTSPLLEDDTFYNREMAKVLRSNMLKLTRENHRQ
ncbi:DUF413 domain-containing protein [Chitinophaga oryzae]|uniref:Macrodomain Ori protein n=1 Tax=Chitinophaga oryzae TaxID=2725414 RepID=A0AAE6ZNW5_9BACT|nr:DUF413 domain-containing protein [Chitinophaga oryzae]QJB34865.1 DUF413 domain-containing protein [Chitinophaga oryzae]QJB41377.1 DUF413 domain-containing protein [Chitinophaga oryzae]